ncbi:MAG: hypothetical protein KC420_00415 [Myxococcales bacterium]|nr:hypothetical protein [Myxococcales bacterium]
MLAQGAGPVTRQKARSQALLGQIDLQRGEYASALRHGLAAEAIYAAVDGGRGVPLLNVRRLIAASLRSEGRQDEAEAAEARLVEQSLNDASLGPKQRNEVIFDRAKSKIDQGDSGEALRLLDELERRGGEPSPSVVAARGWALAAGGRQADAIFWLEEGIDQLTEGNHRAERAVTQWILAEALIATGNDRLRICQLLDACREFYASSGAEAAILGPLEELRAEQRCAPAGTNPESETGP